MEARLGSTRPKTAMTLRPSVAASRVGRILVAIALAGAALVAVPRAALASCDPPRAFDNSQWFWAGTSSFPAGLEGVKADIEEYSPYVSVNSVSTAWVMLAKNTTRYAQVGWWRRYLSPGVFSRKTMIQWTDDAGQAFTQEYPAHTIGTFTTYKVLYDPATDTFSLWDGTTLLYSHFYAWVPNNFEIFGETHNRDDQMPGGTQAHLDFNQTFVKLGANWYSPGSSASATDPTIHGALLAHPTDYDIWDKACTS